ncbi:hypothetical protein B0H14DRAFT_2606410 [Mycena olivaceomarginata]|nr:hypothetical protein B0H14DRAFT_2606410 [Mycena olivaceomarginata]
MSSKRPTSLNSIQNEPNPIESSQAVKRRKLDEEHSLIPSLEPLLPAFQLPLVQTAPNVLHPIRHPPKPAQAPLPKAVTNKIMQLQDCISALEGVAYDLRDKLEERDADIHDLDNENLQLWRRINELEQIHRDKLERIIDFIKITSSRALVRPILPHLGQVPRARASETTSSM